jgi:transcriptional regulator with XRE-family HTH domain
LREAKHFSQCDIERRSGLLRCYISRVENGHTVPAIETLEKLAHAMEVPLYQFFCDGEKPTPPSLPKGKSADEDGWGSSGKDARYSIDSVNCCTGSMNRDRKLLLHLAQQMARRHHRVKV